MTGIADQRRLQDNLRIVCDKIADACVRAHRNPDEVRLVAVTKYVEMDTVRMILAQGVTDMGESRVQQLTKRAAMTMEGSRRRMILDGEEGPVPRWHMVGHLQRNKVKPLLPWVSLIHSVDSLRLAEQINHEAISGKKIIDVLLQINLADEKSKFGMAAGAVNVMIEQMCEMRGLRLRGLMTMAPFTDDAEQARPVFARLREMAEDLREAEQVDEHFNELSMGMTNDYEVAIEEGATIVRVGTALFDGMMTNSV